jgi:RND superfamily putative drug exporter
MLGITTQIVGLPEFSPQFAAMIGIGVGIDYSLLVVTRFREGLHSGRSVEESLVAAVTTAGRSVIFAGVVVAISLLGLFVMGIPALGALGLAGAVVVLTAVGIAVSATPALLAITGTRVDRLRVPLLHRSEGMDPRSPWYRLSRAIQRRPWPYALGSTALLLVLAAPMLTIDLGFTDAGNGSEERHSRRAYDLLAQGFGPGFNGPLVVVADLTNGGAQGLGAVAERMASTPGVAAVAPPVLNPTGDTAVITVIPASSPQADATTDLVHDLRDEVIPGAEYGGATLYVTGATAANVDASDMIGERMPLLFAGVIGLSFVLLMAVFRSVVIAVKAALLNLLSIGAAYGVVVAVFQWGWFGGWIGVGEGPVEVFLPMMMFAIVFGLSMDYQVFLISRIREEYLRTGDTREAVANGLTATARVITAAAAIMATVFLAFVLGPDRIIKQFGLGLAAAILVDATLVRIFLVPSAMELMGKANWWMPRWLDRILPNIHVEGPREGSGAGGRGR